MTEADMLEYIADAEWKFAKSMPKFPHWYVVRWDRPDVDHLFTAFAQHIRDNGYPGNFFKKKLIYLDIGEYKYWTMGSPIHNDIAEARASGNDTTYILNRALHGKTIRPSSSPMREPNGWF